MWIALDFFQIQLCCTAYKIPCSLPRKADPKCYSRYSNIAFRTHYSAKSGHWISLHSDQRKTSPLIQKTSHHEQVYEARLQRATTSAEASTKKQRNLILHIPTVPTVVAKVLRGAVLGELETKPATSNY